jgi:hypothetical protein
MRVVWIPMILLNIINAWFLQLIGGILLFWCHCFLHHIDLLVGKIHWFLTKYRNPKPLDLNQNYLQGDVLLEFVGMKTMCPLNMTMNYLTNEIPPHLDTLSEL